jgi:dTDP-4-dehydrorhamnose reductase
MNFYKSIVITGGGGMLAHALADEFRSRGHAPHVFPRAQCDLEKDADLRRIFAHSPTLVLNCAAHTKVDLAEQEPAKADAINGHAVGKLAQLCREHGTVLVHFSTDFVFDGSQQRAYHQDSPTNPLSAYGRSKLLGETELQKHAPMRWLIIRTAWVYGRHGANFPRTIVQAAQAGKPLRVVNDQIGAPTYTVDLARATLSLLETSARGIWHVTNAGRTTWFDFAKTILSDFKIDAPVEPVTSAQWNQIRPKSAPRPAFSVLDIEPYAKQTHRPMRQWSVALKDFVAAVQQHGF